MTSIADFSRNKFNDFAVTNLILIDGLVDILYKGSVQVPGLGQTLADSGELLRLRSYGQGNRAAYLFLSEKELADLSAGTRGKLDIITAFRGVNETINLATRFSVYAEEHCASGNRSDEDVEMLQRAISICRGIINHGNDVDGTILSAIRSSYESAIDLIAITAAQRGSDGLFALAVANISSADQR